jgi:UDP-N-acetylmuramoyl-L-alanyl-D-glutamate--2,6-diaminopimelate ligase
MSIFLSWYHFLWSFLGALFFGFPSKEIFVFGVTGTKGKSTVLELVNAILEAAGKKTALLSSIRIKIDKQSQKNYLDNTMPGRAFIQGFLKEAVKAGCDYAFIEVTSQGILQHRHRFIKWSGALFTNLAPEHIEAHGGFENYRKSKGNFFRYIAGQKSPDQKLIFINKDDVNAQYISEAAKGAKIVFYSKSEIGSYGSVIPASLSGGFNLENIAGAIAFIKSQGIPEKNIREAVKNFCGVPGRMDMVKTDPFTVIIDYAHTPDSLEKVYQSIKPKPPAKLICVLGSAGGGRDKWKRPKMGEIADQYCEEIILTNEDPYDEDPNQILSQIKSGIKNSEFRIKNLYEIINRQEAIRKALFSAKKGDVVVMTGKGCEPWLHLAKGKKIPWDERKTAENEIQNLRT